MTAGFSPHKPETQLPTPPGGWKIGTNIPWTVAWTREQNFELALSSDFPGLVDLLQTSSPGTGIPRFAAMHVSRHRAGMAHLLCHVCGKPTEKRDRYLFPAESGGFVTLADDSTRYAGNVPPLHRACAQRASAACPHLSQTKGQPIPYPIEQSRLMPRTDIIPGMEQLAKTLPQNLTIVYTCYRLFGPRFTRLVQALRR